MTNNNANPLPGPTCSSALDDASITNHFTFDGYDNYFVVFVAVGYFGGGRNGGGTRSLFVCGPPVKIGLPIFDSTIKISTLTSTRL